MRVLALLAVIGCDVPHRIKIPRAEVSRISDRGELVLVGRGAPEMVELDCVRIGDTQLSLGFTPHGKRLFGGCDDGRLDHLLAVAERDAKWTTAEVEFRKTTGRQVAAGVLGGAIGAGLGVLGSYVALRCQPMAGSADDDDCDGYDIVAPIAYVVLGALTGAVGYTVGSAIARDDYRLR